jgi:hypothetical protein
LYFTSAWKPHKTCIHVPTKPTNMYLQNLQTCAYKTYKHVPTKPTNMYLQNLQACTYKTYKHVPTKPTNSFVLTNINYLKNIYKYELNRELFSATANHYCFNKLW